MSNPQLPIHAVEQAGLRLAPVEGVQDRVSISGSGETGGVDVLREFVERLHDVVVEAHLKKVFVDLVDLTFINSSCLKVLVSWVYKVDTSGRNYGIQFVRDTRMHWQKGSLDTLRRLAPSVVTVVDAPVEG